MLYINLTAPEGGRTESSPEIPGIEIRELQGSPTSHKRRSPSTSDSDGRGSPSSPLDATWPRMGSSPRRKKEKDVFKFLKETDPNYTIRRQQLQMNLILEKNQHVKKVTCRTCTCSHVLRYNNIIASTMYMYSQVLD